MDAVLKTYLTINELSLYLKVSKPTIYIWVKNNTIPYMRVNKRIIRFNIAEIDAYMRNSKVA